MLRMYLLQQWYGLADLMISPLGICTSALSQRLMYSSVHRQLVCLRTARIIDETIVPRFRAQDYAGGIEAGLADMMALIQGEPLPPMASSGRDTQAPTLQGFLPQLVVMAVVVGLFLRLFWGRWGAAVVTGALMTLLAWWMLGTLLSALWAGLLAILINLGVGWGLFSSRGGSGRGGGWGGQLWLHPRWALQLRGLAITLIPFGVARRDALRSSRSKLGGSGVPIMCRPSLDEVALLSRLALAAFPNPLTHRRTKMQNNTTFLWAGSAVAGLFFFL
jgi:hypothetical protein